MDVAAASAGPWLLLGVVVGVLLSGLVALATVRLRRGPASASDRGEPGSDAAPTQRPVDGWTEDDLPAFLERPPGIGPEAEPGMGSAVRPEPRLGTGTVPLADGATEPALRRTLPAHAAGSSADPGRVLLVLVTVAVLLVGVAATLAAVTAHAGPSTPAVAAEPAAPTWDVPDLAPFPERPERDDPGAGRLATASVPIGSDGVLARLSFAGVVLERRAVGITAAYPSLSLTAAHVPGGPALAHVSLPAWNCLSDTAPDDPAGAGCRRLPTEYAELATPALTVAPDGDGLRISGHFPTYVKTVGSGPEWTGRVYPLTVHVDPDGDAATGTFRVGTERADAVDDPRLSDFRRGR